MHKGSRLLEFIGQRAANRTMNWLKSKRVEVKLEQKVDLGSDSDEIKMYKTSAGETIRADCHFLCTGIPLCSAWLKETMLKNNIDGQGRLRVDESLRVKGRKNIFAIGDITDVLVSAICHIVIILGLISCFHSYVYHNFICS